jgi:hypothetical protein
MTLAWVTTENGIFNSALHRGPPDGQCRLWVKCGSGRQADGTAGLPPASEYPVRSGTYASCQRTKLLRSSRLRGGKSRETGSQLRGQG